MFMAITLITSPPSSALIYFRLFSPINRPFSCRPALKFKFFNELVLSASRLNPGFFEAPTTTESKERNKDGYSPFQGSKTTESSISIIIVGASGNLARKKIFPALFALFSHSHLPEKFTIFGYGRTVMSDDGFRDAIKIMFTKMREKHNEKLDLFLRRCFYHIGQYSSEVHFSELNKKLEEKENGMLSNRIFYLSLPHTIFADVARCVQGRASSDNGWTRFIIEKPFGHNLESSRGLTRDLKKYLSEDQMFRIDHHLGGELIDNLLVLRFSNLVFEPLWSRNYIRNVQLIFSETDSVEQERRSYFDSCGIIQDIMQNHLLQILSLFAMETPVSLDAEDIRNEKVKVLRSMRSVGLEDLVMGQYRGYTEGDKWHTGYMDRCWTMPKSCLTPTFAGAAFFINNPRWDGVPFLMVAGKALHKKRVEVRVQFRHVPGNLYNKRVGTDIDKATNELVVNVEQDEAIYLKINNRVPGLGMRLDCSYLNLLSKVRLYPREEVGGYEKLLLDAMQGESRSFVRSDELDASWAVFTPVLKDLEEKKVVPELYPCGSGGPTGLHHLAAKYNIRLH